MRITLVMMTFLLSSYVQAGSFEIKTLEFTELKDFAGAKATLFLSSGRAPSFGTPGKRPIIRKVLEKPVTVMINDQGQVTFSGNKLKTRGFDSLSYVLLIVHARGQERAFWENTNGEFPEDPRVKNSEEILEGEKGGVLEAFFPYKEVRGKASEKKLIRL